MVASVRCLTFYLAMIDAVRESGLLFSDECYFKHCDLPASTGMLVFLKVCAVH